MNRRLLGQVSLKNSTEKTIALYTNKPFNISIIWAGVGRPNPARMVQRIIRNELDKGVWNG